MHSHDDWHWVLGYWLWLIGTDLKLFIHVCIKKTLVFFHTHGFITERENVMSQAQEMAAKGNFKKGSSQSIETENCIWFFYLQVIGKLYCIS